MKQLLFAGVLLFSTLGFANDGGMPYIEIEDLIIRNADVGSTIEFHGTEAMSLFNALPSQSVYGYNRGFTATGKKKSVVIECMTHVWDDKKSDHNQIKNGPRCKIEIKKVFNPNDENNGDSSKWINERTPQSTKEKSVNPKKK